MPTDRRHEVVLLVVSRKLIHHRSLELSRRYTSFEKYIQLSKRPSFSLWQPKVNPHVGKSRRTTPKEGSLGSPISAGRVEEFGRDDVLNDTDDVVGVSGEDDGFRSKTSGWKFGDQAVANRTDLKVGKNESESD